MTDLERENLAALAAARERFRKIRVDWFRALVDLQAYGYSVTTVSAAIDVPKATVMGWRTLNAEPSHVNGERLIGLWMRITGKPRDELPLNVQDLLSAARATSKR